MNHSVPSCEALSGELRGEPEFKEESSADEQERCLPGKVQRELEVACLKEGCTHNFLELRGGTYGREWERREH